MNKSTKKWLIGIIVTIAIIFFAQTVIGLIFIIAILVSAWIMYKNYERRKAEINREKALKRRKQIIAYRKRIAPYNWTHWVNIKLSNYDGQTLGQINNQPLKYMFVCRNNVVTFPESKYGNKQGYFITNIYFHPKWIYIGKSTANGSSTSQTSYNLHGTTDTFGGGAAGGLYNVNTMFGGAGFGYGSRGSTQLSGTSTTTDNFGFKMNTVTHQKEIPSNAIITIVTTDLSQSFNIKLLNVNSKFVNYIVQYYCLDPIKKQKIGIINNN